MAIVFSVIWDLFLFLRGNQSKLVLKWNLWLNPLFYKVLFFFLSYGKILQNVVCVLFCWSFMWLSFLKCWSHLGMFVMFSKSKKERKETMGSQGQLDLNHNCHYKRASMLKYEKYLPHHFIWEYTSFSSLSSDDDVMICKRSFAKTNHHQLK